MALLCVPFSYIPVLSQYWPFGQFLCYIVCSAQAVCVFVSAYTLIALAIDRYIAILYPLRPRIRRTQALFAIVVIWIVAVLTAMPIAIFTRLYEDEERGVPLCEEVCHTCLTFFVLSILLTKPYHKTTFRTKDECQNLHTISSIENYVLFRTNSEVKNNSLSNIIRYTLTHRDDFDLYISSVYQEFD